MEFSSLLVTETTKELAMSRTLINSNSLEHTTRPPRFTANASWLDALWSLPLVSRPDSERGLPVDWPPSPTDSLFLGIGICSPSDLSMGLPFDALGYLAFAETVRRHFKLRSLVVHIADSHALSNSWAHPEAVYRLGMQVSEAVTAVGQVLGVRELVVTMGSDLEKEDEYQQIVSTIPPNIDKPYYRRELADIKWHFEKFNTSTKVGWTVGGGRRDETSFDAAYRSIFSDDLATIYCVPGRNDDKSRPRVCPYTLLPGQHRLPLIVSDRGRLEMPLSSSALQHLRSVCDLAEDLAGLNKGDLDLAGRMCRLSSLIVKSLANS